MLRSIDHANNIVKRLAASRGCHAMAIMVVVVTEMI
jgi:hypothetical protein